MWTIRTTDRRIIFHHKVERLCADKYTERYEYRYVGVQTANSKMYPQQQFVLTIWHKADRLTLPIDTWNRRRKDSLSQTIELQSPDKLQQTSLNSTRNLKHVDIGVLDANTAQLESSSHPIKNFLLQFSLVVFAKLNKLTTMSWLCID